MAGLGNYNNRIALASGKKKQTNPFAPPYQYNTAPYNAGAETINQPINTAIQNMQNLQTGYTPEEQLAMRNRIRNTNAGQMGAGVNRLAELAAARGYGGSGAEQSGISNFMRGQNAAQQGALSNLDISNAQTGLQNLYNKTGMMNNLYGALQSGNQFGANLGENARQFDIGQYNTQQARSDYYKQLQDWYNRLFSNSSSAGI